MSSNMMAGTLESLVEDLPEVYQPIYGHPELSGRSSRPCDDRLIHIKQLYHSMEAQLNRPLNVLDLGCAQGFFSCNLAKLGARVLGVDFLAANIAVCECLAAEYSALNLSFINGNIETILTQIIPGQYDIVLGLSVFHHLIYENGIIDVQQLITTLASKINIGIFEFALVDEPLYWGASQPTNPKELLEGFAFVHELSRCHTHLSEITRPLYAASNRYWFLNGQIGIFTHWQKKSHKFCGNSHENTRRYFFSEELVAKLFDLENPRRRTINLQEIDHEKAFLLTSTPEYTNPRLQLYGQHENEAWLVREQLSGELLLDIILNSKPYDAKAVLQEILSQLVALEAVGLYHNDTRTWNTLISHEGSACLIDYGSISKDKRDCAYPHNIFLAFLTFSFEVITAQIKYPIPLRTIAISPYRFDQPYRSWVMAFWSYPISQWNFKLMHQLFVQMDNNIKKDPEDKKNASLQPCNHVTENVLEVTTSAIRYLLSQQNEKNSEEIMSMLIDIHNENQWLQKQYAMAEIDKLNHISKEQQQKLLTSNQQLHASEKKCASLQTDYAAAKTKIDELNHSSHHWWTVADGLNRELQSVYTSNSWKITRPLRQARLVSQWIASLPRRGMRWAIRRIKGLAKPMVIWEIKRALANAGLKRRALVVLTQYPQIKRRLHQLALRSSLLINREVTSPTASLPPTSEALEMPELIKNFSPRVVGIYAGLQKTINARKC